jgi:hypothetical protein
VKFDFGYFIKISQENQNFLKIGQKCQALYINAQVHFIVAGAVFT